MKLQHILPLALLAASAAAFSAGNAREPFQLFQFFKDKERKVPRIDEPYRIFLNGKVAAIGWTGKRGTVLTDKRIAGTSQEFLLQSIEEGTYSFQFDARNRLTKTPIGPWPASEEWDNECTYDKSGCKGKGFYWLKLVGKDTDFENEPYALTVAGQRHTGQVAKGGYIFVPHDDAPEASAPMRLQLCDGRTFDVVSGWKLNDMAVTPSAASLKPALTGCEKSSLSRYGETYASLNGGAPYISTQWSKGRTPAEIEQDVFVDYQKIAAANDDDLAWLGAMPALWSDEVYAKRLDALYSNIKADLSSRVGTDPLKFQCKSPAQVGPVPDQQAVHNFLATFPDSIYNQQLLRALHAAAAKGNWLAAVQIYVVRTQFKPQGNRPASTFRTLQLMEWLQARKIGTLYREFGYALSATGYFSGMGNGMTGIDVYAAMHDSYPAQLEVGKEYADGRDPELQAIGKQMIACATSASPGYKKQTK